MATVHRITKKSKAALERAVDAYLEPFHVTPREREILVLMASGVCSADEMAESIGRSVNTVQNHIKGLLRGTGHTSKSAVLAALARHVLEARTSSERRAA